MKIKKFNEVYGGEEVDRNDWPGAPELIDPIDDRYSKIQNLYRKDNRMSSTDPVEDHDLVMWIISQDLLDDILNTTFVGTTKL